MVVVERGIISDDAAYRWKIIIGERFLPYFCPCFIEPYAPRALANAVGALAIYDFGAWWKGGIKDIGVHGWLARYPGIFVLYKDFYFIGGVAVDLEYDGSVFNFLVKDYRVRKGIAEFEIYL